MKRNIWKRILSMFAAIALLVGLMPQIAVKAEAATNTASRDGFTVKLTAHWVLCNSDGKLVQTDAGNYLYYDELLHFDADDIWIYAKTTGGATVRLNFGMHSLETANNVCVWDHNLSVYIDITDQTFDCTKSQGSNKWTASGVGEEIYTTTQPLTSLGFNANACFRVLWNAEITYTPFGSHDYSKQEVTAGTCAEAGHTINKCSHGPCSFYTRTEGSKDPNNHAGTISYEPGGNGKHYKKCSACTLNEEQRCSVNAHICGGYLSCSVCGQRTSDTPIKHILSYAYYSMDMNLQPLNSIELMCYRVKDPNASYSSDKHCMTTNTLRLGDNGTCHRMNAGVYYYTGEEVKPYGPVFSGNTEMWDLSNLKYELRYTGDTVNITPDGQVITCTLLAELPDTKGNMTTFTISETYRIVPVEFDDDGFAPTGAYQPAELVDGVYQVANAGNLFWLAQQGNSGAISDASVVLTADITIPADRIWTPISNGILHFDGQNHTLTIHQDISDTASGDNYGLFGSRGYGTVKNLILEGSIKVNTTGFVGAIAGSAFADTYENVVSRVDVTNLGTGTTGGLAGYYGGKENAIIRNCAVYADISGMDHVGGLIGRGWGGTQYYRFYNCAYQGSLTDGTSIGAMVGYNATGNGSSKPNVSMGNIRLQNCYYNPQNEEIPMFGGSYIHEGNSVEYYATITNCGFRSADAFAGGEVAYLLGDAWGQTIGTDTAPVPGGQKVYQVNHCGQTTYSNTNESWEHSFENGFCTRTEGQTHYQPAELVDGAYQITNPGQLYWFGQQVNGGDYDANAVLTTDLDLEGREWTTICSTDLYYENTAYSDAVYTGTFDGAGHVIRNYTVRGITGTKCSVGLFGTTMGATVKNLGVENMTFDLNGASDVRAAAIVGQMLPETLIENCYVINSTLTPNSYIVGGVAACNYSGIIRNCFTKNVAVSGHARCGNLVSDTRGDISNTDRPGTVENCWTDAARVAGTQSGGLVTGCQENVSAERFASGEVAYALGEAFGQTIGTEDHPVLGGARVYYGYISCAEDAVMVYTNDSTASATPGHRYDENGRCECGTQAKALVTIGGITTGALTLDEAIQMVKDCTTDDQAVVKLVDNIALEYYAEIFSGVFTLDLNGYELSRDEAYVTLLWLNGAVNGHPELTIDDSRGGGRIVSRFDAIRLSNATLNVKGGTIEGTNSSGLASDGDCVVNIYGGTIIGNNNAISTNFQDVVSIYGGTIIAKGHAIYAYESTVTIYGGTISAQTDLDIDQSATVLLALGEDGVGATFPDGLSIYYWEGSLNAILAEGAAYWQNGKQLTVADDAIEITGGDVTVMPVCDHSDETKRSYTDNGYQNHKVVCAGCDLVLRDEPHSYDSETGKCVCDRMAAAMVTIQGTSACYGVLSQAFDSVQNCTAEDQVVVKLLKNYGVGGVTQPITNAELTFDLNGQHLSAIDMDVYVLNIIGGTVTVTDSGEGGQISRAKHGIFVQEGGTLIITGGSFSGSAADIWIEDGQVILGLGENGTGATFPGGVSVKGATLNELLGEGAAYWQNGKQIVVADDATEITGGDVVIRAAAAAETIATGWSGDVQWTLTDDGILTVYGAGVMRNYDYSEKRPWQDYADRITSVVIEEGVTRVGACAFKGLTALESVTLPETGLKTIGEAAFYDCSSLKELYIPDSIYTIWEYTFKKCTALENIRLPKTLEKIDQGAFESCTGLTELFLPTNVNIIGAWSFKGCSGLKEADMQWADATEIRAGAFKNCTALTKITLPANIQVLGDSCFYGIGATSFTVPATVTDIEAWCFARANMTEIVFEGDAPTMGEGAFNKITLTAFYPGDNATWTADVMQNYGGTITWKAN